MPAASGSVGCQLSPAAMMQLTPLDDVTIMVQVFSPSEIMNSAMSSLLMRPIPTWHSPKSRASSSISLVRSQYFETGIAPRIKFSSKKVDALLRKERETFDVEKRKKYMNQAINALMEEVPAHFLWHQKIHYGVANGVDIIIRPDKRIHGYEISVK